MKFPEPNYKVGMVDKRRGAITWHEYSITLKDGTVINPLLSVTKISGIINKPLLVNWAKNMAIDCARAELLKVIQAGKIIDLATLDDVLALAKGAADRYKDAASDVGTRTHDAIDRWIRGENPALVADTKPGFDNFMLWLEREQMRVVMGDTNIASLKHKFGGRSDVYFEKNGKLILGDFKTGKALYGETVVQIGGYDIATEETYSLKVDDAVVLRLGKETPGDIEPKWVNLVHAREAFMYAHGLTAKMSLKKDLWRETVAA